MGPTRAQSAPTGLPVRDRQAWQVRCARSAKSGSVGTLALFAAILTRIDAGLAGRAYAAYGGVYIAASLTWLWLVEGQVPDRWDLAGAAVCLGGAGLILFGPRGA